MQKVTPVLLVILDGFGVGSEREDNAVTHAKLPNIRALQQNYAATTIQASENFVGLPKSQFGNSEVGHLNIGAGRVVQMELTKIDCAIADGVFNQNAVFSEAVQTALSNNKPLHIMGLLSDGGVHSHDSHIHAMIKMAAEAGVAEIYIHAFLDGRDTPPRSATRYLQTLENLCALYPSQAKIASVIGRYFAMDRDKRWERVQTAYALLMQGQAPFIAPNTLAALEAGYARGENDEFIQATVIADRLEQAHFMQNGDVVVFMNFRADRAREITQALIWEDFTGFARENHPTLGYFCSATSYGAEYKHATAYLPVKIYDGLGETLAKNGLNQLRIAETEKYPHVTYFFNGGEETPFAGEERWLIPSPKVATYDLQPEMSAPEVARQIEEAIASSKFAAIIVNFANGDMVGHTGNYAAAVQAVEALDVCVGRVVNAMLAVGGEVLITADHGNCEQMYDEVAKQPHTQHTVNPVPFIYIGRPATMAAEGVGSLQDVAPTLLAMMGIPQPALMTGKNLITWQSS